MKDLINKLKKIGFKKAKEIEKNPQSYSYIFEKIFYGRKHTFRIIFREKNNKLRWYLFSNVGKRKTKSERYKDSFVLLSDDNLEQNHFSMKDGLEDLNNYPKLEKQLNIISKGIITKRKKENRVGFSADLENLNLGDKLYYISKEYGLWKIIKINQKTVSIKKGTQIKTRVLPSWLVYPKKTINKNYKNKQLALF